MKITFSGYGLTRKLFIIASFTPKLIHLQMIRLLDLLYTIVMEDLYLILLVEYTIFEFTAPTKKAIQLRF